MIGKCRECQYEPLSSQATACPRCGAPMRQQTVTVQQTSQALKLWMVLSVLALVMGVLATVGAHQHRNPTLGVVGTAVTGGALLSLLGASVTAWWKHG